MQYIFESMGFQYTEIFETKQNLPIFPVFLHDVVKTVDSRADLESLKELNIHLNVGGF